MTSTTTLVVFLPGTTGSTLTTMLSLVPVWPDQVALAPTAKMKLSLLEKQNLIPGALMGTKQNDVTYGIYTAYKNIVSFFEKSGFTYIDNPKNLPKKLPSNLLLAYPYDWRQDNSLTASALESTLKSINAGNSGELNIWLVAHSMGGLVARGALEAGLLAGLPVKGLITLGTPHLGAPLALSAILGQVNLSGKLPPTTVQGFIDDSRFPSTYQLLPPPAVHFIAGQSTANYNVFEDPINDYVLNNFGASQNNFAAAKTFFGTLNYGTSATPVPYYLVAGIDFTNGTEVGYNYTTSSSSELTPLPQVTPGGDGVVPAWSAQFNNPASNVSQTVAGIQTVENVSHGELPASQSVQQFIADTIGFTPVFSS